MIARGGHGVAAMGGESAQVTAREFLRDHPGWHIVFWRPGGVLVMGPRGWPKTIVKTEQLAAIIGGLLK